MLCNKCLLDKPEKDFFKRSNDGYIRKICRVCNKEKSKRWCQKNPEKLRQYALKRYYNLTPNDYNNLLEKQNHVCRICNQPELNPRKGQLSVDHCHKTNKVRGLLCDRCNNLLGRSNDSISLLINAINYLQSTGY